MSRRLPTVEALGSSRRLQFKWLYLVPILAFIALSAWALASPIGASPDDDYHLTSIWCGDGIRANICEPGTSSVNRLVPSAVTNSSYCYAHRPGVGAACQDEAFDHNPDPSVITARGNFLGQYPPVYYSVMGMFATPNIAGSVVLMRVLNALIFIGMASALFVLLPVTRRPTLIWGWLVSTIPLGLFLIASNNPSSWAITGVGVAWIALLGYFETEGRRRLGLATVFVTATVMAAGARSDAAVYVGLGILAVLVLTFRREKSYFRAAILPLAMGAYAGVFFLLSGQSSSGIEGFQSSGGATAGSTMVGTVGEQSVNQAGPLGLLYSNLMNIPSLWAGNLGSWGLGWIDTKMPAIVSFGAIACFVGVVFAGLAIMWGRKAAVLAGLAAVLWLMPAWVLFRGGNVVGQEVQPRYLLPLIVMFAGIATFTRGGRWITFTFVQRILLVATLSVAQMVALYMNMRRYVQGEGRGGLNLDHDPGWWWDIAASPTFVVVIGSAAFALMVWILVREASLPSVIPSRSSSVEQ